MNLEIAEAHFAALVDGHAFAMRLRGARELALSLVVALDLDLELESKPTPEDVRFAATAAEPARLDALLTKHVRKALGAFKNEVVTVTDTLITVRYKLGRELDDAGGAAVFEQLVSRAIKLALALDRAAASVPVAAALASVVPVLQGLAETHGGTLRNAPLALSGSAGGIRYALTFSHERFHAEARFPSAIAEIISMKPRPTGMLSRLFSSGGRTFGDERFDRCFEVNYETPAGARAILDDEARAMACALLERHPGLALDSNAVAITAARVAPEALRPLVDDLLALARRLSVNAGVLEGPGDPYRGERPKKRLPRSPRAPKSARAPKSDAGRIVHPRSQRQSSIKRGKTERPG